MQEAKTGAVRSVLFPIGEGGFPIRLDLVLLNDIALRRLGATYGEGQNKYGTFNWQKGFHESVYIAHALEHLLKYMSGDKTEDDLAHAVWNLMTLMWVQEKKPELLDIQNARKTDFATLQKHVFVGKVLGEVVSSECTVCGFTSENPLHVAAWELPHPFQGISGRNSSPCTVCSQEENHSIHHSATQRA